MLHPSRQQAAAIHRHNFNMGRAFVYVNKFIYVSDKGVLYVGDQTYMREYCGYYGVHQCDGVVVVVCWGQVYHPVSDHAVVKALESVIV